MNAPALRPPRHARGERDEEAFGFAGAAFEVPADEIRWCAMLAEALSVCCILPSFERMAQVRALIAAPPPVMLPIAWDNLINAAVWWVVACDVAGGMFDFKGQRWIEAALRDTPVPVPSWAERFR